MILARPTATEVTMSTGFHNWGICDDLINEGGEKDMMGLYEVFVLDTKKNVFLGAETVIAKTEDSAKMKVIPLIGVDTDNDNIEFTVRVVKQWESKKPKEVKIVKE